MTLSIIDFLDSSKDLNLLKTLGVDEVEKIWNALQIKSLNGTNDREIAVKIKCLEVLETGYRKPWDEAIFFKIIQMRLDIIEWGDDHLAQFSKIKRLFSELEMSCPFLPKSHIRRSLELKGDFAVVKMKDGIINTRMNVDQLTTEVIEVLVEHKKRGISVDVLGSKMLNLMRTCEGSLTCGRQLEALIPQCEEFKNLHCDLLNILTEIILNEAGNAKKTAKFSELITEAINMNVRSLNLKANVMGYFEFLKLTKLQDPNDFLQAVDSCLVTLKNRCGPNEDLKGKLQIVRLIVNESGDLLRGLSFAMELFVNCNEQGILMVLEDLLCLIEENSKTDRLKGEIEDFLVKTSEQTRSQKCHKVILETLLRLAEKNFTVKNDFKRSEEILSVIESLGLEDSRGVKEKLARCYLRLDKLTAAKELLESISDEEDWQWKMLKLEGALRSQDDFGSLEGIEALSSDPKSKAEDFLSLFNLLKQRLSPEIRMKLLKAAFNKTTHGSDKFDIVRGMISLVYDGVIECGLTEEYQVELECHFSELNKASGAISSDRITWCCQVCWNLGVIHARAEDFKSAQFGFKWCWTFAQKCAEFKFKSGFYYLTAKLCESETEIIDDDFQVLNDCEAMGCKAEFEIQMTCLKIEMLLRCKKWKELGAVLKEVSNIGFESIAEIVLRSSEEVPLEIYQLTLKKLTENEFESQDFDIQRFSGLFRGLTTCALLQFPADLSHFQSALKMIKSSFGRYPSEEVTWLCGTALEMGRKACEEFGEYEKAGEWIEMAMNLVYLINGDSEDTRIIKSSLQESIQRLFEKIVNR